MYSMLDICFVNISLYTCIFKKINEYLYLYNKILKTESKTCFPVHNNNLNLWVGREF